MTLTLLFYYNKIRSKLPSKVYTNQILVKIKIISYFKVIEKISYGFYIYKNLLAYLKL